MKWYVWVGLEKSKSRPISYRYLTWVSNSCSILNLERHLALKNNYIYLFYECIYTKLQTYNHRNGLVALKSELLCLVIKQVQQCQHPPVHVGPVSPCKEVFTLSHGNLNFKGRNNHSTENRKSKIVPDFFSIFILTLHILNLKSIFKNTSLK